MFKPRIPFAVSTLALGMVLSAQSAWANGHEGGDKAEAKVVAHGESKAESKEPDIRPKLKPNVRGEAGLESKVESKTEAKGSKLHTEGGSLSMADLRNLIDQKIAEVHTKKTAAPVVRLHQRATQAKHGAAASASKHGNDEHGALVPLQHGAADTAHGAAVDPHGHDVHWAYNGDTGPESWGRLKPEFQQCMLGKRQSPIDIRDGIPVQMDPIHFDYHPTNFRVIDNGHTVQVNVDAGNSITVGGHRYDLVQFHFHRPSEERINGKQFDMVAHFVHKDMDGKLAVVAVLLDQGKAHPLVQMVWNNLPLEKQMEQAAADPMDLDLMLPEQRQYYTYMGSLTTPPCSEGVLWMVMKQPTNVSREQVSVFGRLYPMNARPVQSVAGRLIKDGQ